MYNILEIISNILVSIGIFFLAIGLYGIFRHRDFYTRIIIAAKVDTVGLLFVVLGIAFRHGISFFTAKLIFIAVIMVVLNPFVASVVIRSATQDNTMPHPEGAEDEDVIQDKKDREQNSIDGPWY